MLVCGTCLCRADAFPPEKTVSKRPLGISTLCLSSCSSRLAYNGFPPCEFLFRMILQSFILFKSSRNSCHVNVRNACIRYNKKQAREMRIPN